MAKSRGRPPKPVEEHELHGTDRPDRHGDRSHRFHADGYPKKPKNLAGDAAWLWDQVIGELAQKRVARHLDTAKLQEMCAWYKRYRKVAKAWDRKGAGTKGTYQLMIQMQMAWSVFDGLASEFGLSPTARARLKIADDEPIPPKVPSRKRA